MGLNVAPQFKIVANQRDITALIAERCKYVRLTDETGVTADTLEIGLADHDPRAPIKIPPTGAELEVSLGYDGAARRMGLFICDEIELSGPPGALVIRARAAPYESSTGGRVDIQSQKSRSWKQGTTIGGLVRRIAGEHRLEPRISESLASIALPHIDQAAESDMNLLQRIARRYDAIAKPAGGFLLFVKRGDAQTATGAALPRVVFGPQDGGEYTVTIASRDSPGTVVAFYRELPRAKRHEVKVGSGEPVRRLRLQYKDRASAEAAALAELRRRARQERTLTYTFPGRPDVLAECIAVLRGFREGVDGDWLITRAEHYIGPNGYRCTIEAEQPNSEDSVMQVNGAPIEDDIQESTLLDEE